METTSQRINHQIITYKLLRAISASLEPESVAYLAVEKVIELTHWPTVAILTPNHEGNLVVRAAMGPLLTDAGINGRAFRTGDTQAVDDLVGESDEGPTYQKLYSALSIPILRGRRALGVFNVENDKPFTPDDVLLAESLSEVIALALDNAELFAQSQRRLAAQTAMQEAASAIASTLDLPLVLDRIAEKLGQAIQATSAYICSYDKNQMTSTVLAEYIGPEAATGEARSDLGATYYLPDQFPQDVEFLERGEIGIKYADTLSMQPTEDDLLEHAAARTILTIPLQIGGDTVAYAELWDSHQRRVFTDEELAMCRGVAQQAAIAMENARLFQAMREEHGRLRALIESDEDGILLIGLEGNILVINAPGFDFLQLDGTPEQWIGRSIQEMITALTQSVPDVAQVAQTEVARVIRGHEALQDGEFEIPPRVIHWRNLPVLTEDGPIGRLIVLRDVTRERALEKIRDDLMHTMVHDLRGPLSSISISLEMLQMMEQMKLDNPEKRHQAIDRAYTSTQKMLTLVEAILEINRLESGHLDLQIEPVSLPELVGNVVDVHLPLVREKEIAFQCDLPDDLPLVEIDRNLMERVLQNLLHNGLKFTPVGGQICITGQVDNDHPPLMHLLIHDSGPGIPIEIQEKLFQKFTRGMQKERGSGLGLYFCKMVLEAHDGRIWLEKSDADGTIIRLALPVHAVTAD